MSFFSETDNYVFFLGGGTKEVLGGTKSLFEYGSNEKGEDQKKKKKVFVPKFPQILVVVSEFLRFSTKSEVKTKKKGLRPKT